MYNYFRLASDSNRQYLYASSRNFHSHINADLCDPIVKANVPENGDTIETAVYELNTSLSSIATPIKLSKVTKLPKWRRIDYIAASHR